jgi:hypothetical protein
MSFHRTSLKLAGYLAALWEYFAERIVSGRIDPLQWHPPSVERLAQDARLTSRERLIRNTMVQGMAIAVRATGPPQWTGSPTAQSRGCVTRSRPGRPGRSGRSGSRASKVWSVLPVANGWEAKDELSRCCDCDSNFRGGGTWPQVLKLSSRRKPKTASRCALHASHAAHAAHAAHRKHKQIHAENIIFLPCTKCSPPPAKRVGRRRAAPKRLLNRVCMDNVVVQPLNPCASKSRQWASPKSMAAALRKTGHFAETVRSTTPIPGRLRTLPGHPSSVRAARQDATCIRVLHITAGNVPHAHLHVPRTPAQVPHANEALLGCTTLGPYTSLAWGSRILEITAP